MANLFGVDRLVFGTGLPLYDPRLPIGGLLFSGLSEVDMKSIAGDNLRKLLGGVEWSRL